MIQAINIQPTYCKPQKVCKRNVSEPKKYSSIAFRGNENSKQVAFISFETVPINKTGGMADVVGELAPELNKLGMDVRVIIPLLNAQNGIVLNNNGQQIYKTPKGKVQSTEYSNYYNTFRKYCKQKGEGEGKIAICPKLLLQNTQKRPAGAGRRTCRQPAPYNG